VHNESSYWDRTAKKYSKSPVADEAAYRRKLEITRDYLREDMDVLEFGCGTGSTAIAHAPFVRHIQAIDISKNMLAIAREKAVAGKVDNVSFERATIDDFPAPDESYDAILGLSILHLVKDRDATIAKVYALLKPGGTFVSSTACLGDTMKFFKLIGPPLHFLRLIPRVSVFTTQELVDSLTRAGFTIDQQWQPGKSAAVFIVAKKPGQTRER
jgi:ubiquinone/menaquinone biosynthesis C-methylase UbiE